MSILNSHRLLSLGLLCSLSLSGAGRATAADLAPSEIYGRTVRATALVFNDKGWGTGWLLDRPRGLLLTNHHVVQGKKQVGVLFPAYRRGLPVSERNFYLKEGRPVRGRVAFTSQRLDLALVELDPDRIPKECRSLPLASSEPGPGEAVHSVGNPDASDALWVYTNGRVRAVYVKRLKYQTGQEVAARVVETDAPINPGDSGGPLVNGQGELIGVNAAIKEKAQLVASAIAVSEVRTFCAAYFNNRGAERYAEKKFRDAVGEYNRALALMPDYARALYNRGLARAVLGQREPALQDLQRAATLDPEFAKQLRQFFNGQ